MAEVTVQGIKTPVIDEGKGEVILFLHGVPDTGELWRGVIDRLKGQFRCIAPDMPGYGGTNAPDNFDYSIANRGQWVEDLLIALNISEPIIMVGHDHGGPFAITWAIQHEDRLRRLVITDTLYHRDYHWHFWARIWRTPIVGELTIAAQALKPFGYALFEFEMRRGSKGLAREHVRQTFERINPTAARQTLRLYRASDPELFAGWDDKFYALIKRVPTLVLWGDKDPYIGVDFPERLRGHGAEVVRFPDAGHWLPVEKATDFAEHLQQFIKQNA
jgi:pimeloyl-ACP methyl ester carboxylesterase